MNTEKIQSKGESWFQKLTGNAPPKPDYPASLRIADTKLGERKVRYIAVVPDPKNLFPRARNGEVGLLEGWQLARAVQECIATDHATADKTVIIAVIDVVSQAYGRREEAYGIHQALAGATGAYANARLAGHPVIGLIVGKAMSGAFLAHGYQANRLIAIDDAEVMVHAMGKAAAAQITVRSIDELETFAEKIPPMAYDIKNYASLGLLSQFLQLENPKHPTRADISKVQQSLRLAIDDIAADPIRDLRNRFVSNNRVASSKVRKMLRSQWQNGKT